MSDGTGGDFAPTDFRHTGLPYADRVRAVGTDEPFRWLAAGWRDFRASARVSLALGLIVVAAGFVLMLGLVVAGYLYLTAPLVVGFMLVGPALTMGYYAVSRDVEAGRAASLGAALGAWRANAGPILGMGLALVAFLVLWMRIAALIFAIFFPHSMMDVQALLNATLFTVSGLSFLAVGTLVGGVLAAAVFAAGAFSLPMMLDRKVGLGEALVTSVVAVVLNARAMAVWAGLVVVFTGAGLAAGYVGLAVTLPLVGHATWHAYRAVIKLP
jgi:uncharacterized membrane protein